MPVDFYKCNRCGLLAQSSHNLSGERHLVHQKLDADTAPPALRQDAHYGNLVYAAPCGTFIRVGEGT